MNLALVEQAIADRIESDSTLTGLITRYGSHYVPEGTATPFLIYSIDSTQHSDGFNCDSVDYTVQFEVVDHPEKTGYDPTAAQSILQRVYGDAMSQSNRQPTYGFHRHTLVMPNSTAGYTGDSVLRTGGRVDAGTDTNGQTYRVYADTYQFTIHDAWSG